MFPEKKVVKQNGKIVILNKIKEKKQQLNLPIKLKELTPGMRIHYAKCCNPIPGDDIGGHITAGRGVVVHTADCRNYQELQHNDKEGRGVVLGWHQDVEGEYRVELKIEVEQQRGIIASLANKISSLDGSIESIKVEERDAKSSSIHIFLAVNNRIHLARVIRRIRVLKSVVKVERVKR